MGQVELEEPRLLADVRGEVQPVRRLADPDLHRLAGVVLALEEHPEEHAARRRVAGPSVPIQRASRSGSVTAAQTSSIGARNSRVCTSTCSPSRCSIRPVGAVVMRSPRADWTRGCGAPPVAAGPADLGLQRVEGLLGRPGPAVSPATYDATGASADGPARSSARGPGRSRSRRPRRAAAAGAC